LQAGLYRSGVGGTRTLFEDLKVQAHNTTSWSHAEKKLLDLKDRLVIFKPIQDLQRIIQI
jgi:hypothetical protein